MRLSLRHKLGAMVMGFALSLTLTLTLCAPACATVEEVAFLRRVAEQYVLAQFQNRTDDIKVEVEAGRLDERRNYGGRCEGYLTAQLRGNEIRSENTNLTTAVSDPNVLVGSRLKRDVRQGEQIRSNGFCVVCKNDKVNIVARSGGLSLKTSGIALQEGNVNESIRVRNIKSDKVISAVVTAPGEVQVIF